MYGEYIAERSLGYPRRFYYNWASDMLAGEIEDLTHDLKDYLESMGWDPEEWLGRVKADDINYTQEDVEELAGILKKYFEKYAEKTASPGNAAIDTMCEDEVEDFISNTIAGCIKAAATQS